MNNLVSLGKTDIKITPVGQGVMQFAGGSGFFRFMFPKIADSEANGIIKCAFENGINWFDTAELYGFGTSERRLASGLLSAGIKDQDVFIATKWMPFMRWSGSIKKTIKKRIENLHPYSIGLHQIHHPYSFSSIKKQMQAMADLVNDGKIRSIGVSNFSENQMRKAHAILEQRGIPLASNQVNYSLMNRKIETNGVLNAAKELGITIIAWSPLQSGILTGKFHSNKNQVSKLPFGRKRRIKKGINKTKNLIDELSVISENHNATISEIALNWLITFHGDVVVVIPGSSKIAHTEQNSNAMKIELSNEELNFIDSVSRQFL